MRSLPGWRLRRVIGLTLPVLALAAVVFLKGPTVPPPDDPSAAPLHPEYLARVAAARASRTTAGDRLMGEIPPLVDRPWPTEAPAFSGDGALPEAFDLRTQDRVTPVRDQVKGADGWAYAAMASLESYLMPARRRDFSEQRLIDRHRFDLGAAAGGNAWMAAAYLSRWNGPREEKIRPGIGPVQHVQNILFLPPRAGPLDNDALKRAVMTYGGVCASLAFAPAHYHAAEATYYSPGGAPPNHAVLVVGWDDGFDRRLFAAWPPGDGAFLCKNSWGTDWGRDGYFHVSYYDASFAPRAMFTAERPGNYSRIYQYDPLGWVREYGYGSAVAWGANVFTAATAEALCAVGLVATSPGARCDVSIYTDPVTETPASGRLRSSASDDLPAAGYFTVPLDSPVWLAPGQRFSIVVRFETPGCAYPLPVEEKVPGYSGGAAADRGQSFWSRDGLAWSEASDNDAQSNLCIKGYTRTAESPAVAGAVRTAAGVALEGVTIKGLPSGPVEAASGVFEGRVPPGWSGSIIPEKLGYIFSPAARDYAGVRGNRLNQDFVAAPRGCAYDVSPAELAVPRDGGPATVTVTAPEGCAWSAVSEDAWIAVSSGGTGSGSGRIRLAMAPNPGPEARSGRLIAAGRTITIRQGGEAGFNRPSSRVVLPECVWAGAIGGGVWESDVRITDVTGGSFVSAVFYAGSVRRGPIALWNNTDGPMTSLTLANLPEILFHADPGFTYRGRLGALELFTQDAAHRIHVVTRIRNGFGFNTQPGLVPGAEAAAAAGRPMVVLGLEDDADRRAACGFFNPSAAAVTAAFTLQDEGGAVVGRPFSRRFEAYEIHAFNPFVEAGVPFPGRPRRGANMTVAVTSGSGELVGFATTVDNESRDTAAHPILPSGGTLANSPGPRMVLPECFWADVFGRGLWTTEVLITDMTGGSVVSALYQPGGGVRRGPFRVFSNAAGPAGTARRIDNILSDLAAADPAFDYFGTVGAIELVTQDSAHVIHVSARIRSGRFSTMLPGLRPVAANTAAVGRPMLIQDLSNSISRRSTCGLFNVTDAAVAAEIRLIDDSGVAVGLPFTRTVAAGDFQSFDPFALAGVPYPARSSHHVGVLVRPISGSGELLCFGASAHSATNDPEAHFTVPLR